ncbi:hypothetical protein [Clostridium sp. AWRP]|uniref:DUF7922 domain-containing protein n=1 Tax=Clostridium sp. AWRP TaxID=2212991 RepID=UPI000FD9DCEB|nr:hypothetical protein [Clostridium sp. AWRP]AZV55252.1 hypothetical protein DMR38_00785 [Clostridium sp. AWRP]
MAQKKSYSRYFIILQEDEKGYSLASDKIASGYAKLEMKNDKCKISYYVQNLKKEKTPYYMMLICNKKDIKNIIKIGEMNIDDYGRADISYEYAANDVAGSGIAMDKVSGAAIVRMVDDNIISVMSGFASTEIPEWKAFPVSQNKSKELEETKVSEVKKSEKTEAKSVFDQYEDIIEKAKEHKEEVKENIEMEEKDSYREEQEEEKEEQEESEEVNESESEEENKEIQVDTEVMEEEIIEDNSKSNVTEKNEDRNINSKEDRNNDSSIYVDESRLRCHKKLNLNRCQGECEKDNVSRGYPKGPEGKFFMQLMSGFKEVKHINKELKRCVWNKVPISSMDDMYNIADYNKYSYIYYPMVGYYPYIKKYNYYLAGYKCDKNGRVKYLIYGIPGTKSRTDQPYGGKSGFVTWVPLKDKDTMGHWLMFYDFRANTIVIPVRK